MEDHAQNQDKNSIFEEPIGDLFSVSTANTHYQSEFKNSSSLFESSSENEKNKNTSIIEIQEEQVEITGDFEKNNQKVTQAKALKAVLNYYLSGQDISVGYLELGQQILLALVSISGAGLYVFPALKFAKKHGHHYAGEALIVREANYATCTSIPGLALLYNATDMFFTVYYSETIPEKLKNYLIDASSNCKRRAEGIGILLGAVISAVPLVFVSLNYPIPFAPEVMGFIQPVVIGIDNTILHFLPLKLAITMPVYRTPILPFEYLIKALFCRTEGQNVPQDQDSNAELYRQQLIKYIKQVQNQLYFKNNWGFYVFNWNFSQNFRDAFHNKNQNFSIKDLLKEFPIDQNWQLTEPHRGHQIIGKMLGVISSLWIAGGCTGYLLETVNDILALTNNNIALTAIMATPSVYFLTVLLTFVGYNSGKDLYHYLTSWGENEPKLPLEFKLYPKAFTLSMIATLYIALHSYAAAEQLIHDSFQGDLGEQLKPYFLWLARTSLAFLSISAMKDFVKVVLRKWAIYLGNDDTDVAARLQTTLEQFLMGAANRIEPNLLVPIEDLVLEKIKKQNNNSDNDEEESSSSRLSIQHMPKKSFSSYKCMKKATCCFFNSSTSKEREFLIDNDEYEKNPSRCGIL